MNCTLKKYVYLINKRFYIFIYETPDPNQTLELESNFDETHCKCIIWPRE